MAMTVCPMALAVGCRKCPIFKVCPLKSVIGDQPSANEASQQGAGSDAEKSKSKAKGKKASPRK